MVDAELFADVDGQRLLWLPRQLARDFVGQVGIDSAHLIERRELDLLAVRVVLELEPLLLDLGGDQLVLRGNRDEFASRHGERACGQPGEASQHDGLLRKAAATDAGDQGDVGDQPVHGAEDRRPQPAPGHVAVLVHIHLRVLGGRMCVARQRMCVARADVRRPPPDAASEPGTFRPPELWGCSLPFRVALLLVSGAWAQARVMPAIKRAAVAAPDQVPKLRCRTAHYRRSCRLHGPGLALCRLAWGYVVPAGVASSGASITRTALHPPCSLPISPSCSCRGRCGRSRWGRRRTRSSRWPSGSCRSTRR